MVKQTRKERVEISELKKSIDCLIKEIKEIKQIMSDIEAGLNATPATPEDIPVPELIVEPTMPSSPTEITMQTSHHIEAIIEPVSIKPIEESMEDKKPPENF